VLGVPEIIKFGRKSEGFGFSRQRANFLRRKEAD